MELKKKKRNKKSKKKTKKTSKKKKPLLIKKSGPTGSGKSKLAKKIMKLKNIKKTNIVKLLLDDYIEQDISYHNDILDILKEIINSNDKKNYWTKENFKELKLSLNNPNNKLVTGKFFKKNKNIADAFKDAYMASRNTSTGCVEKNNNLLSFEEFENKNPTYKKKKNEKVVNIYKTAFNKYKGCDRVFNVNLAQALLNKKNIIFETQGSYYPTWLIEAAGPQYDVLIAYTLVDLNKIYKRIKGRAFNSTIDFISGKQNAPRLPQNIDEVFKKINSILIQIIKNKCWNKYPVNSDFCGSKSIIELLVFDNNKDHDEYGDISMIKKLDCREKSPCIIFKGVIDNNKHIKNQYIIEGNKIHQYKKFKKHQN